MVRGSKPCHIQAVDPGGPAAAAGMKVRTGKGALRLHCCQTQRQTVGQRLGSKTGDEELSSCGGCLAREAGKASLKSVERGDE